MRVLGLISALHFILLVGSVRAKQTTPRDSTAAHQFACAIAAGDFRAVRALVESHAVDASSDYNDGLRTAAAHGFITILRFLLLQPQVDVLANDNAAIKAAAENGHTAVFKELLHSTRADPAAGGNYALRVAVIAGHIEIVRLLVGDRRVTQEPEILLLAIDGGCIEIVALLLDDIDIAAASFDETPILHALRRGEHAIARMLHADGRFATPASGDYGRQ